MCQCRSGEDHRSLTDVLQSSHKWLTEQLCQYRSGEDHRSLTDVLQDLEGQLKGQEPKLKPGQTQSRPLHVVLQVTPLAHRVHAPFTSPLTCRDFSSLAADQLLYLKFKSKVA